MKQNTLALLGKHFEERMGTFRTKVQDTVTMLEGELEQLKGTFGDEVVEAECEESPLPQFGWVSTPLFVPPAPIDPKGPKPPKPPKPGKKAGRKRRRPRKDALSFSTLKPVVLGKVAGYPIGEEFTTARIQKELKKEGVKFAEQHISLILSKYMNGITVIGKAPRKGPGAAPNQYKVTGPVTEKVYIKTT